MEMTEWACRKCGGTERYNNRDCKACAAARSKAYHEANRGAKATSDKARYEANREAVIARSKAYYEANRDAAIARSRAYYGANREAALERCRAWNEVNPEKRLEAHHRRRARKRGAATEKFTLADIIARDGPDCYICGVTTDPALPRSHPDKMTHEHVIPLSRGGTHTLENSRIACLRCNVRKGAHRTPEQTHAVLLAEMVG